jgi:hypothetical protein
MCGKNFLYFPFKKRKNVLSPFHKQESTQRMFNCAFLKKEKHQKIAGGPLQTAAETKGFGLPLKRVSSRRSTGWDNPRASIGEIV